MGGREGGREGERGGEEWRGGRWRGRREGERMKKGEKEEILPVDWSLIMIPLQMLSTRFQSQERLCGSTYSPSDSCSEEGYIERRREEAGGVGVKE